MYKYTIHASGQIVVFHQPREIPEIRDFPYKKPPFGGPKNSWEIGGYNLTLPGWVMGMVQLPMARYLVEGAVVQLGNHGVLHPGETCWDGPIGTSVTLQGINIAPENRPLEKEIPIGNHHLHGYVSFLEGNSHSTWNP